MKNSNVKHRGEQMRVLRIAHSSLTPALRERERALARGYPDVDLEVVSNDERWREAEVEFQPCRTICSTLPRHRSPGNTFNFCVRSATNHRRALSS